MRGTASICILVALALCANFVFTQDYNPSDFAVRDIEKDVRRPPFCSGLTFPSPLPNATIIVPVLNEEPAVIDALIRSILAKTPPELLDSIIIVDDFSEFLPISPGILRYPKVQLVRNDRPMGVAGARMVGAEKGAGEILIFLDSQMEVTEGWLEPLISYVVSHPYSIAIALIDEIDQETGQYRKAPDSVMSLELETLAFKWTTPPGRVGYLLYSPIMLGPGFAIRREWFDEGGKYDPENRVWGLENLELPVRVWTCGGDVVVLPCSRIGHIYRNGLRKFRSPRFGDPDFYDRNAVRFAEVWMDEHAEIFYSQLLSKRSREWIDEQRRGPGLEERKQLREAMRCKPFSWFWNTIVLGIHDMLKVTIPDTPYNMTMLVDSVEYDNTESEEEEETIAIE